MPSDYNWPDKTLYDILTRKEYLGHTITGKTYKVSYKSKKTKKNPEEKRYFFPNTHEPLIDEETFELAQKRIATRQRPTKVDEIDLFSGLLFCGDCGYKMYAVRGAGTLERKHAYTCGNYRNRARNDMLFLGQAGLDYPASVGRVVSFHGCEPPFTCRKSGGNHKRRKPQKGGLGVATPTRFP